MKRIAIAAAAIVGIIPAASYAIPASPQTSRAAMSMSHCDRVIITTPNGTETQESCDYYPDGHV